MANHPPYCVVLTYLEDRQEFALQAVDRARFAPLIAGQFEIPILLDEFDFRLDDEFAQGLGATMLNLIALGQPDIKQYMSVTQRPDDRPSEE
ncbi:hypothetical protein R69658_06749 [Paraburkholderia aspalathi]|jgi:hypothetical protein|uniref:Uncharacterized protein n=1 Tax=Paraburkholderia aspalathi TaxID=1324617 RepID=A0ABM8SYA5_9BURK|nr:hypothetical protein [Paraburkholderia aspalathi]MBK3823151.1 hypothetical protein [Paraburkholderia aspalathi]MBK3834960.1 hypothetical protein [Paraburkholderia aspalathi]MBK3864691.1 hypothetical protein [Paraburkholderia aspalathi]CAE6825028.1 hypothetical protein R20943_06352 [Paraburkholderia aspalathi]CAE6841560.1 hypothetical protein R69658_06749 [Paraburkholderia aspalathi]